MAIDRMRAGFARIEAAAARIEAAAARIAAERGATRTVLDEAEREMTALRDEAETLRGEIATLRSARDAALDHADTSDARALAQRLAEAEAALAAADTARLDLAERHDRLRERAAATLAGLDSLIARVEPR